MILPVLFYQLRDDFCNNFDNASEDVQEVLLELLENYGCWIRRPFQGRHQYFAAIQHPRIRFVTANQSIRNMRTFPVNLYHDTNSLIRDLLRIKKQRSVYCSPRRFTPRINEIINAMVRLLCLSIKPESNQNKALYDRYLGENLAKVNINHYTDLRNLVNQDDLPIIYTNDVLRCFHFQIVGNREKAQQIHDRIFFVDDKMAFIFGDSFIRFFKNEESTFSTIFRLDEDEYRNVKRVVDRVWGQ